MTSKTRKRVSLKMYKLWKDPIWRAKTVAKMRKKHKTKKKISALYRFADEIDPSKYTFAFRGKDHKPFVRIPDNKEEQVPEKESFTDDSLAPAIKYTLQYNPPKNTVHLEFVRNFVLPKATEVVFNADGSVVIR